MRSASKSILLTVVPTVLGITLSTPMNSSADALPILLPFHAVIHGTANPFPIDACTPGNHETASGRAVHLGTISGPRMKSPASFLARPRHLLARPSPSRESLKCWQPTAMKLTVNIRLPGHSTPFRGFPSKMDTPSSPVRDGLGTLTAARSSPPRVQPVHHLTS